MRTLVTDHHLPAAQLPEADAIVNPNQPGCDFPAKNTAGVGVIFYVMLALRRRLREMNWFTDEGLPEPNLAELLDLVAVGTVADVVSFDRNNRILVQEGLRRIRAGRARPGIRALLKAAGRNPRHRRCGGPGVRRRAPAQCRGPSDRHVHRYRMACSRKTNIPPANWPGRWMRSIGNAGRSRRKWMSRLPACWADLTASTEELPAGLCLYEPGWHQGVVGIVASRIKDRLHRPVIAFAANGKKFAGRTQGFGPFDPGISHTRDALEAIAGRHPGLVTRFGGHAMAAGLSLEADRFGEFQAAFAEEAARQLGPGQTEAKLFSDGPLEPQWFSLEIARLLRNAGPWGKDFPEPVFDGRFRLRRQQPLKKKHLRMTLSPLEAPEVQVEAIAFNVEDWPDPESTEISLAYRLDVNEFRGERKLQLVVERILAETLPE